MVTGFLMGIRMRPLKAVSYTLCFITQLLLCLVVVGYISQRQNVATIETGAEAPLKQRRVMLMNRKNNSSSSFVMNRMQGTQDEPYQDLQDAKSNRSPDWIQSLLKIGRSERNRDVSDYTAGILRRRKFDPEDLEVRQPDFDINESDIVVNLHIQKTGGTFFETLIAARILSRPPCDCKKTQLVAGVQKYKCSCLNNKGQLWNFNRFTTTWEAACGVHPDYTTLVECLPGWYEEEEADMPRQRRFHYISLLRDPVHRFLSEWLNVRRGALWSGLPKCDKRSATLEEIPRCTEGAHWYNVSMQDFMNCKSNLGINRMTRMLANLSLSDCYRLDSKLTQEERDEIMLASAKYNLAKNIRFFGFLENLIESARLFDYTFKGLSIASVLTDDEIKVESNHAGNYTSSGVQKEEYMQIVRLNQLDIRLYQFAKDLFLQRLEEANIRESRDSRYSDGDTEQPPLKVIVY